MKRRPEFRVRSRKSACHAFMAGEPFLFRFRRVRRVPIHFTVRFLYDTKYISCVHCTSTIRKSMLFGQHKRENFIFVQRHKREGRERGKTVSRRPPWAHVIILAGLAGKGVLAK
jgi:hypothetical protein